VQSAKGPKHALTGRALSNLGMICQLQQRYDEAAGLYREALAIREKALGTAHPDIGVDLNNLGNLEQELGHYDQAEALYDRALSVYSEALGQRHPDTARVLSNLQSLSAARGDLGRALEYERRVAAIHDELARRVFSACSARQRQAFSETLRNQTDAAMTLCVEMMAQSAAARRAAMEMVLARKGWLLAAELEQTQLRRQAGKPELGDAVARLRAVREQLASLAYSMPAPGQVDAFRGRWDALMAQEEELDATLSRLSGTLAAQSLRRRADLDAVAAALPAGSVLVEYLVYGQYRYQAGAGEPSWGRDAYAALVLPSGASDPACVPLGPAEDVEGAVRQYREAIYRDHVPDPEAEARLYDLVWRPLEPYLAQAERVLIAPDGELNLVPFGALPVSVAEEQYLCERHVIQMVTSGRDLLAPSAGEATGAVLLADPAYETEEASPASEGPGTVRSVLTRGVLDLVRGVHLAPLPDTRDEATSIAEQLRRSGGAPRLLLGAEASEGAVKSLSAPRELVFSTHGFFLEDAERATPDVLRTGEQGGSVLLRDPMHRSGLALAGAQQTLDGRRPGGGPTPTDDGVLTAEEVAGLDLGGSRLVVLSACDTGVGEVRRGEGVMGLRRAFSVAGAQAVVMSLWKVPSRETARLMIDFHERYLACADASLAMAQAQRDALRRQREVGDAYECSPWHWGAFVVCQSGTGAP